MMRVLSAAADALKMLVLCRDVCMAVLTAANVLQWKHDTGPAEPAEKDSYRLNLDLEASSPLVDGLIQLQLEPLVVVVTPDIAESTQAHQPLRLLLPAVMAASKPNSDSHILCTCFRGSACWSNCWLMLKA